MATTYHKEYLPFNWRGWWAYGTGALGDMGCHLIDPAFKTVGLGYPTEVECSVARSLKRCGTRPITRKAARCASIVKMKFPGKPGKPDVNLHWMDGGLQPGKARKSWDRMSHG